MELGTLVDGNTLNILFLLLVGGVMGFFVRFFSTPIGNASLRRRLGQTHWGVARIVGLGRNTIEKRIDLREEGFTLHDNKWFSISAALKHEAFYMESGVPVIDYDAKDCRPLSHRVEGGQPVVSSVHMQRLAMGMMATIRAKFLNSLTALLENKFLPVIVGVTLLLIVVAAVMSFFGAMAASNCEANTKIIIGYVNQTGGYLSSHVANIPVK